MIPGFTQMEAAAERAYRAFIEDAKELLPPMIPNWAELPAQVRHAWMAAIAAAAAAHDQI